MKKYVILFSLIIAFVAILFSFKPFSFSQNPLIFLLGLIPLIIFFIISNFISRKSHVTVCELWIYPIKSCGGVKIESGKTDWLGFEYDRRWMISKPDGTFITARQFPILKTVKIVSPPGSGDGFKVQAENMPVLHVPEKAPDNCAMLNVTVWGTEFLAADTGKETSQYFSKLLNIEVLLLTVNHSQSHSRPINKKYAEKAGLKGDEKDKVQVGFADAFPFHLTSIESLNLVNKRLTKVNENEIEMQRFRPNIVVKGCSKGFDEDYWTKILISNTNFLVTKACDRCAVPTILPNGKFHTKFQPIKEMRNFRQVNEKVFFGQNLVHEEIGDSISVGDIVTVLERATTTNLESS